MYKVAVILPVYNAESTLNISIESVINQTIGFENIEFIIVDDESSDNSRRIISEYSAKYDNIKSIFLEENTGLPSIPRNIAISNTSAPYLLFLDSDDELMPDCCEVMYDSIISEDADICYCETARRFRDGIYVFNRKQNEKPVTVENRSSLRMTVWANIFKTSFITDNNIEFPLFLPEDSLFAIQAYGKASKIVRIPNYHGYVYNVEPENQDSLTHQISKERFMESLNGHHVYLDYVRDLNFNEKEVLTFSVFFLIMMFIKVKTSRKNKFVLLEELRQFENKLNFEVVLSPMPINFLNKLILNKHYDLAIFASSIAGLIYNNDKIKNWIFKRHSKLQKLE